jgi:hypothetical protein
MQIWWEKNAATAEYTSTIELTGFKERGGVKIR